MFNETQSENNLSASSLRTQAHTYTREKSQIPADIVRSKKVAKDSNKPKRP